VVSLNTADGAVLWKRPIGAVSIPTYDPESHILYAASSNGGLQALSAADGSILWTQKMSRSGLASSVQTFQKDRLLVTWTQGPLMMLNAKDGSIIWESRSPIQSLAPASSDDTRILVLSTTQQLHRFVYEARKDDARKD
jgi:outer membrane protein assembly factor BamB